SSTATSISGMTWPAGVLTGCVVNARWSAGPGDTVNALLVSGCSDPEDATSVYPVAALAIDRSSKVATPSTEVRVVWPSSVASGSPPASETVTSVGVCTRLPSASSTSTVTGGLIASPACTSVGCWSNSTLVASPAVMSNDALVSPCGGPGAVAFSW